MQCPVDQTELAITYREGIEIDYCPKCRGVWLDRGELDKLIERSAQAETQVVQPPPRPDNRERRVDDDGYQEYKRKNDERYDDDQYHDESRPYAGKRRKSFLGDVFDIFD